MILNYKYNLFEGLVSAVSNLFGKTKGYVKDEELFADLSD